LAATNLETFAKWEKIGQDG